MTGEPCLAFPPTRKVLWDRTPRGPARHLSIELWDPVVEVSTNVCQEIAHDCLNSLHFTGPQLVARCAPRGRGRLAITIDRRCLGQELGSDEWHIPCSLRQCHGLDNSGCPLSLSAGDMRAATEAREHRLDKPGPPCPGACFAWTAVMKVDVRDRRAQLQLWAEFPQLSFSVVLLATPLRTLQTPLFADLVAPQRSSSLGWGFLTLDISRRVVCLHEMDALAHRVPLVGVWIDIAGGSTDREAPVAAAHWDALEIVDNPLIWSAASRFLSSKQVCERVWVEDKTFLVLVVHRITAPGDGAAASQNCASFFEANYDDSGGSAILAAPYESPLFFNVDTSSEDRKRGLEQLSVRLMAMSDAPIVEGEPRNPEEDVPLSSSAWTTAQMAKSAQMPRSSEVRFAQNQQSSRKDEHQEDVVHAHIENIEQPRSMLPTPHPGPEAAMSRLEAEREEQAILSATFSPERVHSSSPSIAVDDHLQQLGYGRGLESPAQLRRSTGKTVPETIMEEVRLSDSYDDLASVLHSALGLNASVAAVRPEITPSPSLSQRSSKPSRERKYGSSHDENRFLRELVGMQQTQMMELQRQVSGLHTLMAGIASNQTSQLISTDANASTCAAATNRSQVLPNKSSGQNHTNAPGSRQTSAPAALPDFDDLRSPAVPSRSLDLTQAPSSAHECHQSAQDHIARLEPKSSLCDAKVGDSIDLSAESLSRCDAQVGDSIELPASLPRYCDASVNTSCNDLGKLLRGMKVTDQNSVSSSFASESLTNAVPEMSMPHSVSSSEARQSWPSCEVLQRSCEQAATAETHKADVSLQSIERSNLHGSSLCEAASETTCDVVPEQADCAGGGMPRRGPKQAADVVASVCSTPDGHTGLGYVSDALVCDVPRIIWNSSDSSDDSSVADHDIASDADSVDSVPVLGIALGLGNGGRTVTAQKT